MSLCIEYTYRDEDLGRTFIFEIEGTVGEQRPDEPVDVQWQIIACKYVSITLDYSDAHHVIPLDVPKSQMRRIFVWFNKTMSDQTRELINETVFAAHNRLLAGGVGPRNCEEDVTA